jgi:hypothetical protein
MGSHPGRGLGEDVGLCVVTILQAWFIYSGVREGDVATRPIMQLPRNGRLLSSTDVISCLRGVSERHGVARECVVIHSLKHGALTALGAQGATEVDIALVGGHKTIESSRPYLHPSDKQGERVSSLLGVPVTEVFPRKRWRGV